MSVPATSACVLLPLQAPPGTASDKLMEKPLHTVDGPVIVPADNAPIVMFFNDRAVPQAVVRV